ncbi:MAG: N-acetylmuramidase [Betaproteobacteria bacterium]|nr:N-acetylmuramidase [Betaproteobacteria bacterium]MCL2885512.1 N-acetylmuramidase [Betaproteobacteria bacterium]
MADFLQAYESMIRNEGGYKLTNVAGDRGGMTYAGIARNMNPTWPGWAEIDQGEIPDVKVVRRFYRTNFWTPVRGKDIVNQDVARNIFDFAVNAGVTTSVRLAQTVAGATPDGKFGPLTLAAINAMNPQLFVPAFALAKIARYRDIVTKDSTQQKFLLGWINRVLREAAV